MSTDGGTKTIEKDSVKLEKPKMYKVIFLNDDYTTFEFVIDLLTSTFRKSFAEAEQVAREVHLKGAGVAGVYTYEVAETKIAMSLLRAKEEGFPLMLEMEPE